MLFGGLGLRDTTPRMENQVESKWNIKWTPGGGGVYRDTIGIHGLGVKGLYTFQVVK